MSKVRLPILFVSLGDLLVPNNENVLRVSFLGRLGEIKRAGHHADVVHDDYFVVSDGVARIDVGLDSGVGEEIGGGIFLGPIAPIQNRRDFDSAFVSIHQRLCDRC